MFLQTLRKKITFPPEPYILLILLIVKVFQFITTFMGKILKVMMLLKLDCFENKIRFTNFKKPHPMNKYEPYFDKFIGGWSCSYEEIEELFKLSSPVTIEQLNKMAKHWGVPLNRFINTLLFAFKLLCDACLLYTSPSPRD